MDLPSGAARLLPVLLAGTLSPAFAGESPAVVHLDERFDSGRNRHGWRHMHNGTCGRGTSRTPAMPARYDARVSREASAAGRAFRDGSFELRAVSGRSGRADADECGVFLLTAHGADDGLVLNGGPPLDDWSLDVRFRLEEPRSVLYVVYAFGGGDWRSIALSIPAAGLASVPDAPIGRVAVMRANNDPVADNEPLRPGEPVDLELSYSAGAVSVRLNGRLLSFSGGRVEADAFGGSRPFRRGGLLSFYTEAQLDAGMDSRVKLLSVRLVSTRRTERSSVRRWIP